MQRLTRRLLPKAGHQRAPERVLQIGEGRFIRAFVDWLLQELAQQGHFSGSIVLTPARARGKAHIADLAAQDGLFTVWTRGLLDGKAVDRLDTVTNVSRALNPFERFEEFMRCAEQPQLNIVVSNTTELGIVYRPVAPVAGAAQESYPARLTAYLAHRFAHFKGDSEAGMVILPTELVQDNGATLREIVLRHAADWHLGTAFEEWVLAHNSFCSTLVDRIVPGMPADADHAFERLGYTDTQLTAAEPYYLWALEADPRVMARLPFQHSTLNVRYTPDLTPYRLQKLRVLNGTHSFLAPPALLLGCTTVREAITHPLLGAAAQTMVERITIPHTELDAQQLKAYAETVFERFRNPFIAHNLRDITLNALDKFRIRLLPVLERYVDQHRVAPKLVSASLACLLELYRPGAAVSAMDDTPAAEAARAIWRRHARGEQACAALLADQRIWQADLTALPDLERQVQEAATSVARGQLDTLLRRALI